MQSMKYNYSVVMPCLNEEKTLATCIRKIHKSFLPLKRKYEIIVADNGSTDKSIQIAKKEGAKVVNVAEKGYGAALQAGICKAEGKYIIMGDADDSYDFLAIEPFVNKIEQGYDLVMGNRFAGRIMPGAMPWQHQFFGNPMLSLLGRIFFRSPVGDFYCGMRAFRKKAWDRMALQTTGMEYAIEMVAKASILNMKITEIPITLYKDGRQRRPHLRTWHDGFKTLHFMLLFAPNWLFLSPGLFLIFGGTILFSLTLVKPAHIFGINLDVHTLLISSTFISIGIQILFLGLFAKIFIHKYNLIPTTHLLAFTLIKNNLNRATLICGVALLIGLIIVAKTFLGWYQQGFGALDYSTTMRMVIPAAFLIQLGFQVFFNTFFLGVILLPRKSPF
ncbi:MAG: glycosyltransferase family 2 protein [Candidatus Daviesbacteria bacterium]|nr:glycosyltransferase family 2 protein [Candidatus Daviesbacteria bacterium]